jgi:uncharacterized protein
VVNGTPVTGIAFSERANGSLRSETGFDDGLPNGMTSSPATTVTRFVVLAAMIAVAVPALATVPASEAPACREVDATTKPIRELVLEAVTNGSAGRDMVSAVFAGDRARVRALAQRDPALLLTHVPPARYPDFRPDGQWGDLLSIAIIRCDTPMLEALLAASAAPDGAVPGLPLDTAVAAHDLTAMRLLLAAGATPDPSGPNARWPLRTTARVADPAAAKLLIAFGARIDRVDATGSTALQDAVDMDAMRVAEVLVEAGANPWAVGAGGALPAYGIGEPLRLTSPDDEAARMRLEAKLRAAGTPWPAPNPGAVKAAIREGRWPPEALATAGATAPPPAVLQAMGAPR